jgi:2-methylcitrate dehydratase PrpD
LALREALPGPAEATVRAVEVETYGAALAVTDAPEPTNAYQAKFSLQYTVAQALRQGQVALADFSPDRLGDPEQRDFMRRVQVAVDPDIDRGYPAVWSARVRVRLADGTTREAMVDAPKGDPETALTDAEMRWKFTGLLVGTPWDGAADALAGSVAGLSQRSGMAGWLPTTPLA